MRVGINARSQGDVGRIMVVLLTDGRANISLGRSNDDPDAMTVKPTQVSTSAQVMFLIIFSCETRARTFFQFPISLFHVAGICITVARVVSPAIILPSWLVALTARI